MGEARNAGRLDTLLLAMADYAEAIEVGGARARIEFTEVPGAHGLKLIPPAGFTERRPRDLDDLELLDLQKLAERDRIVLEAGPGEHGTRGVFHLAAAATGYIAHLRGQQHALRSQSSLTLNWADDIQPVLQAIYDVQSRLDPAAHGVSPAQINQALGRSPDDEHTERVLIELDRNGYLADVLSVDGRGGPLFCRLSEKGLQQVAGWPQPGALSPVEDFLALLEERISAPDTQPSSAGTW